MNRQMREFIFQMVAENPTWGAPRIHGELLQLGFDVSERTVSRWVRRAPQHPDRSRRWKVFLSNHRERIAAMDFFTVPTLIFNVLYCFFVIAHDRRRIVHFNLTRHPNSFWIAQQLREAFPAGHPHKYLILIVMGSLDMRCFRQWMRLSLCLSGLHSGVRDRTEWQSVGSKAAGVICSIKRNRDS